MAVICICSWFGLKTEPSGNGLEFLSYDDGGGGRDEDDEDVEDDEGTEAYTMR